MVVLWAIDLEIQLENYGYRFQAFIDDSRSLTAIDYHLKFPLAPVYLLECPLAPEVAYQYHKPQPIENMANPKQVAEVVRGTLAKFKSTPKAKISNESDRSQLSKLNSRLKDPILYPEAVKRAKNAGYHLDYSRNGIAIRISEPEF